MKPLIRTYIVFLHLMLAGVIWKSDFAARVSARFRSSASPEISGYYNRIVTYHLRSVDAVPNGAVIFIGDSITQGLAVAAVHPLGGNYGIGADTTKGVLERLSGYMPALERAGCVVIAIGINDSQYRSADDAIQNYIQILDALPQNCRVIVSAVLPIDIVPPQERSKQMEWNEVFNLELARMADERQFVMLIDSSGALDTDGDGLLDKSFNDGDGIHLNSDGNLAWAAALRDAIRHDEIGE